MRRARVVVAALAVVAASCDRPVACADDAECADGEACGADGFCAPADDVADAGARPDDDDDAGFVAPPDDGGTDDDDGGGDEDAGGPDDAGDGADAGRDDDAGPAADGGEVDAGGTDAGSGDPDAGVVLDAGPPDAGVVDAGDVDAGSPDDAGEVDAGDVDGGVVDAGVVDAGVVDAGGGDEGDGGGGDAGFRFAVISDNFNRGPTDTIGSPTTGGAYTVVNPANAVILVDQQLTVSRGDEDGSVWFVTQDTTARDVEVTVYVWFTGTTSNRALAVVLREQSGAGRYEAEVSYAAATGISLSLGPSSGPMMTAGDLVADHVPGTVMVLEVLAVGASPTTLCARLWKFGDAKPATCTLETTDGTAALQQPGFFELRADLAGAMGDAVVLEDYTVVQIGPE